MPRMNTKSPVKKKAKSLPRTPTTPRGTRPVATTSLEEMRLESVRAQHAHLALEERMSELERELLTAHRDRIGVMIKLVAIQLEQATAKLTHEAIQLEQVAARHAQSLIQAQILKLTALVRISLGEALTLLELNVTPAQFVPFLVYCNAEHRRAYGRPPGKVLFGDRPVDGYGPDRFPDLIAWHAAFIGAQDGAKQCSV